MPTCFLAGSSPRGAGVSVSNMAAQVCRTLSVSQAAQVQSFSFLVSFLPCRRTRKGQLASYLSGCGLAGGAASAFTTSPNCSPLEEDQRRLMKGAHQTVHLVCPDSDSHKLENTAFTVLRRVGQLGSLSS